jgi:hypothetical protein
METRTIIAVHGFNRNEMQLRLEELKNMIDENKKNLIKLKVMAANSKDENSNIDSSVTQKNPTGYARYSGEYQKP